MKTSTKLLIPALLFTSLFVAIQEPLSVHATGDFSLTAPGSVTCVEGRPSCRYTVTVTSLNGFSATVTIVPPSSGSVTVQGSSGDLTHSVTTHLILVTYLQSQTNIHPLLFSHIDLIAT